MYENEIAQIAAKGSNRDLLRTVAVDERRDAAEGKNWERKRYIIFLLNF